MSDYFVVFNELTSLWHLAPCLAHNKHSVFALKEYAYHCADNALDCRSVFVVVVVLWSIYEGCFGVFYHMKWWGT